MAAMVDDLWRECAAWLTRCKLIPLDHKANWPESEIRVLALTLRDGVLLCNLVNFLDPHSLDMKDFHRKPHLAQFLCCQNIKLFLDTCKNYFGLRETDLFEPTMLYDLTNFHRVLLTLSRLSTSRKVQMLQPNLPGFHAQMVASERSHSDEDIYKDLHTTTSENAACNDHDEHDMKEEEVYQDLCSIQRISRNQLTTSTGSVEQRDFVIRELIDTETNYLEVLNALYYKFMIPMEKIVGLSREIQSIFPKIRELSEIHTKFLKNLKDAIGSNSKLKLSQVFLEFREPFLIYGEYCSNMTNATDTLRDICKRSAVFEELVQQCQKEHSGGRVQLRDILSVPMQRILKYHLLLDKLVHETSPTHDDYRGLERAKEAMVDVAQYTNEVKRDSEHMVVIQKVRESIIDLNLPDGGSDLVQYGHLLLDGELNIKGHEDQKTKHRYAFIFEKIMILVKNSNSKLGDGQYTFREAHNLLDYRVEICHSRKTLGRDARFKCQLLLAQKSQSNAFTLYMKTDAERVKWLKAFQEAMDNLEPPGCRNTDHKFSITTFDAAVSCTHCSKFLKGRIHQGYQCKVCKISVHKGCISSTGRCRDNSISHSPPVCDRQLTEYYWFVGQMDRDTATLRLENRKVGTYLLRVRPQGALNAGETMYALSLKTDNKVIKHMKIYQKHDTDNVFYFLSTRRQFKSIVELISFYERNDLGENFAGLNQTLQWPFREVIATAFYDFVPQQANQLPLRTGCQIVIVGKEGDSNGWWRGKTKERVGFFPKEFVREHPQTSDEL